LGKEKEKAGRWYQFIGKRLLKAVASDLRMDLQGRSRSQGFAA
jgi:hypothetical protein